MTGKEKAAAIFRNKIKYGQEGALVGGGFPLVGKAISLGYRYGLKPVAGTTASIGAKGVDNFVFKPIVYLGSTKLAKPVVSGASKAIQGVTKYALSNTARLLASGHSEMVIKQLLQILKSGDYIV